MILYRISALTVPIGGVMGALFVPPILGITGDKFMISDCPGKVFGHIVSCLIKIDVCPFGYGPQLRLGPCNRPKLRQASRLCGP